VSRLKAFLVVLLSTVLLALAGHGSASAKAMSRVKTGGFRGHRQARLRSNAGHHGHPREDAQRRRLRSRRAPALQFWSFDRRQQPTRAIRCDPDTVSP
jgi:hypothetical protein